MLSESGCKDRLQRFQAQLNEHDLDAAIISDHRDIYYLTGNLLADRFPAFLFIRTDGPDWLVTTTDSGIRGVDECITFDWNTFSTLNFDMLARLAAAIDDRLSQERTIRNLGWQSEAVPKLIADRFDSRLQPNWQPVDSILSTMQQCKDDDEVDEIRATIRANLGAYDAAREVIAPGVTELEVLTAAIQGATKTAGEKVFHDGDYRSGERGGPARNRPIEAGEFYIIDAWTVRGGYWSDLCRAFCVGQPPSDLQATLFEHIAGIQAWAGKTLRPGLRGTELWKEMDARIREFPPLADVGFVHHAGHGVGLHAHEEPDLNRDRDREGILQPGNIVSVEPGGYVDEARVGVRIENTYLITDEGAENLSDYPIDCRP